MLLNPLWEANLFTDGTLPQGGRRQIGPSVQRGLELCFYDWRVSRAAGFAEVNAKPLSGRKSTFLGHWCSGAPSGVPSAPPGGK